MSPKLDAAIRKCHYDLLGLTPMNDGVRNFTNMVRLAIKELEQLSRDSK